MTVGWCTPKGQGFFQGLQQVGQAFNQQSFDRLRIGGARSLYAALEVVEHMLRGLHAGIGHQQSGFEFFVQSVVNARAHKHTADALACAFEALPQACQPALTVWVAFASQRPAVCLAWLPRGCAWRMCLAFGVPFSGRTGRCVRGIFFLEKTEHVGGF